MKKETTSLFSRSFLAFLLLFFLGMSFQIQAQPAGMPPGPPMPGMSGDEEEEGEEGGEEVVVVDWHETRAELEAQIRDAANAETDARISPEITVNLINSWIRRGTLVKNVGDFKLLRGTTWKWNRSAGGIAPPTDSLESIVARANQESIERAEREFPESKIEDFRAEADRRYVMYKVNDYVEFSIRNGYGNDSNVSGYFTSIDNEKIIVKGSRTRIIIRGDLDDETEAKFYLDKNEKLKADYVQSKTEAYHAAKENAIYDWNLEKIPGMFLEAGYAPNPAKPESSVYTAKPEYWVAKNALLSSTYSSVRATLYATIYAKKEAEIFASNQWVKEENENGEVEWMPASEAERIKALKANPNGQPNGPVMPNGPMPPKDPNHKKDPNRKKPGLAIYH